MGLSKSYSINSKVSSQSSLSEIDEDDGQDISNVNNNNTDDGKVNDDDGELNDNLNDPIKEKDSGNYHSHKPVPPNEVTLFSFPSIWMVRGKDRLFGKCFGSERGLYFGSNIFGSVREDLVLWTAIQDIVYTNNIIMVNLINGGGLVEVRTFRDEQSSVDKMYIVNRNARCERPKSGAELRKILKV